MQDFINDGLTIIVACLVIAVVAIAIIVFRPWKRRDRRRRRHSRQARIDLFKGEAVEPAAETDA